MVNIKRGMAKLSFALILYFIIECQLVAQNRILTETFDGNVFPPAGWNIINGNPSPTSINWVKNSTSSLAYANSSGSLVYHFNPNKTDSAYSFAVSPSIQMTVGNSYYVVFYARVHSSVYPENLAVTIGQGQSVNAQNLVLNAYPGLTNVAYQRFQTSNFYPTSSGNYNFGFLCYSPADQWDLLVDSVNFYESNVSISDVSVLPVNFQGLNFIPANASQVAMSTTVKNNGSSNATFTVTRKITPGNYSNTQTITSLAPNSSLLVNFVPLSSFNLGTNYKIYDSVYYSGDINPLNDTATADFSLKYPKNILIYYQDTASKDSIISHLSSVGYSNSYDIVNMLNPINLDYWNLVILLYSSTYSWAPSFRNTMQNYLNNGTSNNKRSLFIFGDDIGYNCGQAFQSLASDTLFYANYLHARYIGDNWFAIPGTNNKFHSQGLFSTTTCDTIGGLFPDFVKPINGGLAAYKPNGISLNVDTANAVYYVGTNYNMFYGTNTYSDYIRNASTVIKTVCSWAVNAGTLLPVQFLSWNALYEKPDAQLNWTCTRETNNKGFYIEFSLDGMHFNDIGFVESTSSFSGIQSYHFTHQNLLEILPLHGNNVYYRLRQVDLDGKASISNVIHLFINKPTTNEISIYPIPFNNILKIETSEWTDVEVQIRILNESGKLIYESNKAFKDGKIELTDIDKLNSGMYLIQINSSKISESQLIMK